MLCLLVFQTDHVAFGPQGAPLPVTPARRPGLGAPAPSQYLFYITFFTDFQENCWVEPQRL